MKQALIGFLRKFSYPQTVFASTIEAFIDRDVNATLIDAPCGEGVTSYYLAKYDKLKVYGYDINTESIDRATTNFKRDNLSFGVKDVHEVAVNCTKATYFCIINSLFLLPEPEKLLMEIHDNLQDNGVLFVIVPNADSRSFRWFEEQNPGVNKLVLRKGEFNQYFLRNGWVVNNERPILYAASLGRRDIVFLSIFAPVYLQLLNKVQTVFKMGEPNYFLLVLKRKIDGK